MDPLSIASSIAGLMTLADVVFRQTFKYAREVKDAKKDVQSLANEIRALAGILHNLSLTASALEDEDFDPNLRMHHINACRHTLMHIDKRLSKARKDLTGSSKFAAIQRKLKWPFSTAETKELLEELARHKDTISLAVSADSMDAILRCLTRQEDIDNKMDDMRTGVKKVMAISTRIELDRKRQRVLDFFMKVNPQPSFETSRELRHPMTGLWLTESEMFKSWLRTEKTGNSRLWLSGIPGAGKTVLAGSIIEEALKETDSSVAVAFFFCNHGNNLSQSLNNILGTLAAQIAMQSDGAFSYLEEYYRELNPSRHLERSPSLMGLNQVIRDMAGGFDNIFIIVDGLDECGDDADGVVEALHSLATSEDCINMALLSRDEQNIRAELEDSFFHVEIAAHKEDLQLYVPAEIDKRMQTKKLRIKSASFKDEITRKLIGDADGMFRWVACQLDYLCELPNDKARRDALNCLPPTLNATYERILERINNSNEHVRAMVQKVLQFVAWAPPDGWELTIPQLCEAISMSECTTALDPDDLIDIDEVTLRCSSLVRISHSGSRIEFAHFTVKEFLEGDSLLSSSLSHFHRSEARAGYLLAEAGLRILGLAEFSKPLKRSKSDIALLKLRNKSHPFYLYSCRHLWTVLTPEQLEDSNIFSLLKELLSPARRPNLVAWSLNLALQLAGNVVISRSGGSVRQYSSSESSSSDSSSGSESSNLDTVETLFSAFLRIDYTSLHFAASLGLFKACQYLVSNGADVNLRSRFGSPLHCAVSGVSALDTRMLGPVRRHVHTDACVHIIDLLLSAGANGMDHIRTPFWRAPFSSVAFEVSFRYKNWSLFAHLIEIGMALDDDTIVRFERRCDGWFRGYLLHTKEDANDMIEKIFNSTTDLKEGNSVVTQLHSLAWDFGMENRLPCVTTRNGHLLPEAKMSDENLFMAMTIAIEKDDVQYIEDAHDDPRLHQFQRWHKQGYTLLHLAAKHCSPKCLDLLMEYGLDASVGDKIGQLPIHLCATDNHEDALEVLMRHKISTISPDINGATPWHLAAWQGLADVLKVLMQNKCEIGHALQMTTTGGYTPLSGALHKHHEEVALLLIEHCHQEACFQSPMPLLNYAAEMASETLIEELLNAGVKPCHDDPTHPTPLNFVTREISPSCLKLLMSLYPTFSSGLADGKTALEGYLARELRFDGDHQEIVIQLFGAGDPESRAGEFKKLWEFICSRNVVQPVLSSAHQVVRDNMDGILDLFIERGVMAAFENATKLPGIQPLAHTMWDIAKSMKSASSRPVSSPTSDTQLMRAFSTLLKLHKKAQFFDTATDDPAIVFALRLSVLMDNAEVAWSLLDNDVNVHYTDDGFTPLHMACIQATSCGASLFEKVLEHADKTKLDDIYPSFDLSLLHFLGTNGVKDAIPKLELLVKAGANPNLRTRDNNSYPSLVWYILTQGSSSPLPLKLLELGGDPTLKNNSGFDAALAAALMGNQEFLVALRQKEVASKQQFPWSERCVYGRGDPLNEVKNVTALHLAAFGNAVSCLEFYLEEGIFTDLNVEAERGWTPLHMAARGGQHEVVSFLLSHGANINAEGPKKVLPLHLAVQHRSVQSVKTLVEFGSATTPDGNGLRPLDYAEQLGHPEIVSILTADKGTSDESAEDAIQLTKFARGPLAKYLEAAIVQGDLDLCKRLVRRGVSVDSRMPSCHDCSPLLRSLQLEKPAIVRWLLDSGADTRGMYCKTHWSKYWASPVGAVDAACCLASAEQFLPELLTRFVSDGGGWIYSSHNPLHTAAAAGNKPAVDTFLAHVKENPWKHLATNYVTGNSKTLTEKLLTVYVNQFSDDDALIYQSPLHVAICFNQLGIARTLLDHGADINIKTGVGMTPLHLAAEAGNLTIVEALLEWGALMESRDQHQNTPLAIAVDEGNLEAAKFLIKRGANWAVKEQSNRNLLQVHCEFGYRRVDLEMFLYLLDLGVDPTEIADYGTCALHVGLRYSKFLGMILRRNMMVRCPPLPINEFSLLDRLHNLLYAIGRLRRCMPIKQLRSIIDIEPPGQTSLLCRATAAGLLDGMEELFKIGADIEHEGSEHGTALMSACFIGEFDAVRLLVRRGARLSYESEGKIRSAFTLARQFPEILEWLLVKRFVRQEKLEFTGLPDAPEREIRPWSGITVGKLDLKGTYRRKWDESSIEYAERLSDYRIAWQGDVLPSYDPCSTDGERRHGMGIGAAGERAEDDEVVRVAHYRGSHPLPRMAPLEPPFSSDNSDS
ncbi:hypothetical protein FQN54_006695 [Arachnomyces sp. PD_36]|nr:hypothetical protein FQN54_006695 [Arachnomyces sp. PD_36]